MTRTRRPTAWRIAAATAALVAIPVVSGACSSNPDAAPTVASVDFEPRLVVTADSGEISAVAGPRDGAEELDGTAGDWSVPDGSVMEVRVTGSVPQRITARRSTEGGGEPTLLLDTGELQPGEDVVVALTEPGDVALSLEDDDALLTIRVLPGSG